MSCRAFWSACAAFAVLAMSIQDAAGQGRGVPGDYAFFSARSGNNDIYVTSWDGRDPLRITDDAGSDVEQAHPLVTLLSGPASWRSIISRTVGRPWSCGIDVSGRLVVAYAGLYLFLRTPRSVRSCRPPHPRTKYALTPVWAPYLRTCGSAVRLRQACSVISRIVTRSSLVPMAASSPWADRTTGNPALREDGQPAISARPPDDWINGIPLLDEIERTPGDGPA